MSNIQIAHEAPFFLMDEVRLQTDYDYALVHLFEDPDKNFALKYYNFFKESLNMGRKVILDNSIFELGKAFSMEKFFDWVYELQPTEYIIPDVLESCEGTLQNISKWKNLILEQKRKGKHLKSKAIAVVQGMTEKEAWQCFERLQSDPFISKIAISFDYSWYLDSAESNYWMSKVEKFMRGRQRFVQDICSLKKAFKDPKPLHLLGCFLPQEFKAYKDFTCIESLDTSNPVVHGLVDKRYTDEGLKEKEMTKLVEFMKKEVDLHTSCNVFYNIQKFRSWAK